MNKLSNPSAALWRSSSILIWILLFDSDIAKNKIALLRVSLEILLSTSNYFNKLPIYLKFFNYFNGGLFYKKFNWLTKKPKGIVKNL